MLSQGINIWGGEQFAPLFGAIKRFFTEIQSSLSQHYTVALTFAEGETLSIDFATTSTGNEEALLGDNPSAHALLIRTDGKIELVGATTVVFNSVVTDGLLNTFKIVRTGTGVEGFLNGVSDGTGTISGDITFTRVAGQNGNYFNGIVANLTKDLTHDLPFDEDFATTSTAVNYGSLGAAGNATAVNITDSELFTQEGADWLGVELVTNGGFDTDVDWDKINGATIAGGKGMLPVGNAQLRSSGTVFTSGNSYRIGLDIIDPDDLAELSIHASNFGQEVVTAAKNGLSQSFNVTLNVTGNINLQLLNFNALVDNISVKRLIEVAP